ncbi:TatD family hydrolase [Thermoanaerobacterium sp. RBIITD]|uniref:TatD family hydrolase n=1 Tax=Thermoanaerobacterium sp. RBIITD TaxID=1550240 RepID=UPI000BB69E50|nr:TatD family hydrolase [Thermoanaerobacterium sp. RBIITD]SNX53872.1 TatD DNase family protein [Thermoanaerobacterium sp. RBIITD]
MLIDSHAHLEDEKYDDDRDDVIRRCKDELTLVINVGSNIETSKKSIELAKSNEFIYAAIGIHPEHSQKEINDIETIEKLLSQEKVVAIGEIGLDYYYGDPPVEYQKQCFIEQIRLAKKYNLPIVIHDRDAHGDVLDIVKNEWTSSLRGVFHSYSGSSEMAFQLIEMNFYISLGGPVTFKNAKKALDVASKIPIEKLLIETDSPYLTPVPYRGKRNEPVNVKYVAKKIAEIKNIDYEEVCNITANNSASLFSINL